MGTNSINTLDAEAGRKNHELQNYSRRQTAPKSQALDVSDETTRSGSSDREGKRKNEIPFHSWNNVMHQSRFQQFKPMGWLRLRKQHNRSIIRRRNVRPGPMTKQVWWWDPISDSSSRRVRDVFRIRDHDWRRRSIRSTFFDGSLAIWLTEFNWIPRGTPN